MLFPPLLVPPKSGRFDTWYCDFAFVAPALCACTGARITAQQTVIRPMKRIWLDLLVVNCVVIFCLLLLNFYDDTLGTGFRSSPEPFRAFRTSHFSFILACDS